MSTTNASPPPAISSDTGQTEREEKQYDSDGPESEVEHRLPRSSALDERGRLELEEAQLNDRIAELELIALRQRNAAMHSRLLALQAEIDAGAAELGIPSSTSGTVIAPVVVTQTPARTALPPRVLTYHSRLGRKAPTAPYAHDNRWQCLEPVNQQTGCQDDASESSETGRGCAAELLDIAQSTVTVSGKSLARTDATKAFVPVRKVRPPDPAVGFFRPVSGAWPSTGDARWRALCMGGKKVDGKSTGSVAAYTALFLRHLTAVSEHGAQSSDAHVIGRYVEGIKMGREALYTVMFGERKLLLYETLQEAIDAAKIAEDYLKVCKMGVCTPASESLRDLQGAFSEQNEQEELNDPATVVSPPQLSPCSSRMCDEGLVSYGPGLEEWSPTQHLLCQTQEDGIVKESECGGDLRVSDERSAGGECLLPLLAGNGRLWSSSGVLWSSLCFVRLVVGCTETGVVEVQMTVTLLEADGDIDSLSKDSAHSDYTCRPQKQLAVSTGVSASTEGTCLTSPAFMAADGSGSRVICESRRKSFKLVVVTNAKRTKASSPRPRLPRSASACAEHESWIVDTPASPLADPPSMDDPGGIVSDSAVWEAVTAQCHSCVWAREPVVFSFLLEESGVSSRCDAKAGHALWDGVAVAVHATVDGDQRRKEWGHPPSAGSEFGAASWTIAVIVVEERSGVVTIVAFWSRLYAARIESTETERSASMRTAVFLVDPIGHTNGALFSDGASRAAGVLLSTGLLGVEGGSRSVAIVVRAPCVVSQLVTAEVCALLVREVSGMASVTVGISPDTCRNRYNAGWECGKKVEGGGLFSAASAASAARMQSLTAMAVVPFGGCDVRSATPRSTTSELRIDVVCWTRNGLWVGHSGFSAMRVRPTMAEGAHQEARDAVEWMRGVVLARYRMRAGRMVEEQTLRFTACVVKKKEEASSVWDDERCCCPERSHLIIGERLAEGVAANSIVDDSSGWTCGGLLIVGVRKDQGGVLTTSKLCIAVFYRCAHARMKEDDELSPLVVATFAEPCSVTELSVFDLMVVEGCGALQQEHDPMSSDGGALRLLSCDGWEGWKAVPFLADSGPTTCSLWHTSRVLMRGRPKVSDSVLVYAADVLVCSCHSDDDTRASCVGWEWGQLQRNGSVDPERCECCPSQVNCVGHAFSAGESAAEQQLQYAAVVVWERPSSLHPAECTVDVRCCLDLMDCRFCLVKGHLSAAVLLLNVTCMDSSNTWEDGQGLRLAPRHLSAVVDTALPLVVADAEGLIHRSMAIVLAPMCRGLRVVQLMTAGPAGLTWTAPFVKDVVGGFERRWPSEADGSLAVVLMTEAVPLAVMVDVCDGRINAMIRFALSSGVTAARLRAAERRMERDGPQGCHGCCRRHRAALPAVMTGIPTRECCVWGRGLSSQLPASLGVCLEERASSVLPVVATVGGSSKGLLEALTAGVEDGWRMKVEVVMILCHVAVSLWKEYSMDDCTWEAESRLANANESVIDYERRLLAEENGSPSVMLLCVGGGN